MITSNCPVCDIGTTTQVTSEIEVIHKGHIGVIESFGSTCDSCGSYIASAEHLRENKKRVLRFKARIDFGRNAEGMPSDLLRAIYDRNKHLRGTALHYWTMRLSRTQGDCRLPRGLWPVQLQVGWRPLAKRLL